MFYSRGGTALVLLCACALLRESSADFGKLQAASTRFASPPPPASCPGGNTSIQPLRGGSRVTFAESTEQEPTWGYETPPRASRHSFERSVETEVFKAGTEHLFDDTAPINPGTKQQPLQTILITPRAAVRQREEEDSPSKVAGASPVSSYSSEADESPMRVSTSRAPLSAPKTPRTLERSSVFRTPNPKGLRYSPPQTMSTPPASLFDLDRVLPSSGSNSIAGLAAYQKCQLEHLEALTRTQNDEANASPERPRIISRISLAKSAASPSSAHASYDERQHSASLPEIQSQASLEQVVAAGGGEAMRMGGEAQGGADVVILGGEAQGGADVGNGDLEGRTERLLKGLEETAGRLRRALKEVEGQGQEGRQDGGMIKDLVTKGQMSSSIDSVLASLRKAKADVASWGESRLRGGVLAIAGAAVVCAAATAFAALAPGSASSALSSAWLLETWDSLSPLQALSGAAALAIWILAGRMNAKLIARGAAAAAFP